MLRTLEEWHADGRHPPLDLFQYVPIEPTGRPGSLLREEDMQLSARQRGEPSTSSPGACDDFAADGAAGLHHGRDGRDDAAVGVSPVASPNPPQQRAGGRGGFLIDGRGEAG